MTRSRQRGRPSSGRTRHGEWLASEASGLRRAAPCERPSRSSSLRSWPRASRSRKPLARRLRARFPDRSLAAASTTALRFSAQGWNKMQRPPHCPNCDQAWPDEYTFYDCPVATGVGDHRHWCAQLRLRLGRVLVEDGVVTCTPAFGDSDVPRLASIAAVRRSSSWPRPRSLPARHPVVVLQRPPCKASRDFSIEANISGGHDRRSPPQFGPFPPLG